MLMASAIVSSVASVALIAANSFVENVPLFLKPTALLLRAVLSA